MKKIFISLIFLLSVSSFSKVSFEKKWKSLNTKQKAKLSKIAKKIGADLSTVEGRKLFDKKLQERKAKFKKLSPEQKKKLFAKRIKAMKTKLKKKGLSDKQISKIINKRKSKMSQALSKYKRKK